MPRTRRISVAPKAILGVGFLLLICGAISHARSASDRARQQLMQFRASLTLGLSLHEVEKLLKSTQHRELTLHHRDDVWIVATPMEFGASNWDLHLVFTDKSLTGILVRSLDEPTKRPADAPPVRVPR